MIHVNAIVTFRDDVSKSVKEHQTPKLHQFVAMDPDSSILKKSDFVIFIDDDGATSIVKNRFGDMLDTRPVPEPKKPFMHPISWFVLGVGLGTLAGLIIAFI